MVMTTNKDEIDNLLRFDAVQEAEDLTGRSAHNDHATQALAFRMAMVSGDMRQQAMLDAGDTPFSCTIDLYDRVLQRLRFEQVLEIPFHSRKWGYDDEFRVYARQDGLLLTVDTFGGKGERNAAKVLYNWKPTAKWRETRDPYVTSSGHFRLPGTVEPGRPLTSSEQAQLIWIGDHDAREALARKLETLHENGHFVSPWVERPFLWLLHYDDAHAESYDYRAITAERLAMLPGWVRGFIGTEP